jgi:hypothetical protein
MGKGRTDAAEPVDKESIYFFFLFFAGSIIHDIKHTHRTRTIRDEECEFAELSGRSLITWRLLYCPRRHAH